MTSWIAISLIFETFKILSRLKFPIIFLDSKFCKITVASLVTFLAFEILN